MQYRKLSFRVLTEEAHMDESIIMHHNISLLVVNKVESVFMHLKESMLHHREYYILLLN